MLITWKQINYYSPQKYVKFVENDEFYILKKVSNKIKLENTPNESAQLCKDYELHVKISRSARAKFKDDVKRPKNNE